MVLCGGCGGATGDQSLAAEAVLRSADLPRAGAGVSWDWDSGPPDKTAVPDRCVDFDFPRLVLSAEAASDGFESQAGSVASFSGVYEGSARKAFERLADRVAQCMREARALGTAFEAPAEVKVREIPFPRMGERSRAFEIKTGSIEDSVLIEDFVLVHQDRTLALLYFSPEFSCGGLFCGRDDKSTRFFHGLLVEMAEAVASRM